MEEALELGFFHLSRCLVKKGALGTKVCSPVVIVKDQNICQYAVKKRRIVITKLPLVSSSIWPGMVKTYF